MTQKAEAEYKIAWGQQLLQEHRNICGLYRISLKEPVLDISDGSKTAGSWNPEIQTMKIAGWILNNYDWQVVLLVLKHEMAHQYVSDILHADSEVPHGVSFQRACDRLGLMKPEFRSATGHIPRFIKDGTEKSTLSARIEKLFALAGSTNEHEASLALQKANDLMRRHNIERLSRNIGSDYDTIIINHKKKRIDFHQRLLCSILNEFYFVNVLNSSIYDQHTLQTYKTIELCGEKSNLAIAEHVYYFIEQKLLFLWRQYRKEKGVTGRERRSFFIGILRGFQQKLEQGSIKKPGEMTSALIHVGDQGLGRYYSSCYPSLRTIKTRGPRIYQDTFQAGKKEGARLNVHKGVCQADGNRGKLIAG